MKVGVITPFVNVIKEPFIGGATAWNALFVQGLQKQSIEVVCYACEGTEIPGIEIRSLGVQDGLIRYPQHPLQMNGVEMHEICTMENAIIHHALMDAMNDDSIDLIHNSTYIDLPILYSEISRKPIVHTIHTPPPQNIDPLPLFYAGLRAINPQKTHLHTVAVSHAHAEIWREYAQRQQWEYELQMENVVYNGIEVDDIPVGLDTSGDLAFVGRIDPAKGLEDAIEVSCRLNVQLHVYGAPLSYKIEYFHSKIEPLFQSHDNIKYYGLVNHQELYSSISKAKALVFPVKWEEPFGYVIVEAMAAGTPVVAYDRGAARELIKEGIGGFVVPPDDINALSEAILRVNEIDRRACAEYARNHFSLDRMINTYIDYYKTLL